MATAGESSEFKKTEFRGCSGDGRTSFRLEIIHRFSPPLFCGNGFFMEFQRCSLQLGFVAVLKKRILK